MGYILKILNSSTRIFWGATILRYFCGRFLLIKGRFLFYVYHSPNRSIQPATQEIEWRFFWWCQYVCCNNKSPRHPAKHVAMGYFYSTSVSILDGTLVSKMGHLHMASCDAGRFTPQIWGFSFDPQRGLWSATRTQFIVSKIRVCGVVDSTAED